MNFVLKLLCCSYYHLAVGHCKKEGQGYDIPVGVLWKPNFTILFKIKLLALL